MAVDDEFLALEDFEDTCREVGITDEIVKFNNDSVEVDVTVSPLEETVWLTQEQMALLFNVNVPAINKHIRNIISENE